MLVLRRMLYPNEYIKDTTNGDIISFGQFYYVDIDIQTGKELGTIISLDHYYDLLKEKREEEFENSDTMKWFRAMESDKEYREELREKERELREAKVLELVRFESMR